LIRQEIESYLHCSSELDNCVSMQVLPVKSELRQLDHRVSDLQNKLHQLLAQLNTRFSSSISQSDIPDGSVGALRSHVSMPVFISQAPNLKIGYSLNGHPDSLSDFGEPPGDPIMNADSDRTSNGDIIAGTITEDMSKPLDRPAIEASKNCNMVEKPRRNRQSNRGRRLSNREALVRAHQAIDEQWQMEELEGQTDKPDGRKIGSSVKYQMEAENQDAFYMAPSRVFSESVHGLAVRAAANPSTAAWYAALWIGLSASTLLTEIVVLFSMVLAASHPRCTENSSCRLGEFCSLEPKLGVGHCKDCYAADSTNNTLYCDDHDTLPRYCDFLDKYLTTVTPSHIVILCFVSLILCMEIYNDLREAIDEVYEFRQAAVKIEGQLRYYLLQAYVWFATRARVYIIPVQIVGSTAALLLNDELSVQNIVLNGAGVGFILRVDDLLGELLPYKVRHLANQLDQLKAPLPMIEHRLLVLQTIKLCILLVSMILMPEQIMKVVGDETANGGMVCGDIVNVCRDYAFLVGFVYAFTVSILRMVTRHASVLETCIDLSLTMMLALVIYRFLRFWWTMQMYLVAPSPIFRDK